MTIIPWVCEKLRKRVKCTIFCETNSNSKILHMKVTTEKNIKTFVSEKVDKTDKLLVLFPSFSFDIFYTEIEGL